MAIKKPLKKKTLQEQAIENTTITKGTSANQKVVKEGVPLDRAPKYNMNKTTPRTVGINIGITKNMGDFESLRVDCWITDEILEGETQSQALARLGAIASSELERQVEELAN